MLRIPTVASSPLESHDVQMFVRISLRDLAGSTARRIMLSVAGPLVLLQLLVAARWPDQYSYLPGQPGHTGRLDWRGDLAQGAGQGGDFAQGWRDRQGHAGARCVLQAGVT